MQRVVVLGATGSIGRQTLDIVRAHSERLRVVAMSAGSNVDLFARQVAEFQPQRIAIADNEAGMRFRTAHPNLWSRCTGTGAEAVAALAAHPADIVVNALLGYAGLRPTLAALQTGTDVALANKESMVVAGELVREAARATGARVLPVDSEHSAIHQCLRAGQHHEVRRLLLTASGGPFRTQSRAAMQDITPAQALRHPTWSMGAKITIDSATLMNKGFEVLEARWLFDVDFDKIDIVVHPESIVHSLVEFEDGSMIAQLGATDMRLPIWYALHAAERPAADFARLDLAALGALHFEPLDRERFPCVELAVRAGKRGGMFACILNAANEVAVAAFLDSRLRFVEIPELLGKVLDQAEHDPGLTGALTLETLQRADAWGRDAASHWVQQSCSAGGLS